MMWAARCTPEHRHQWRTLPPLLVAAVLLQAVMGAGCSNSILRNAAEAGIETALDAPLPTPTSTRRY